VVAVEHHLALAEAEAVHVPAECIEGVVGNRHGPHRPGGLAWPEARLPLVWGDQLAVDDQLPS
jgi:hypothetical protein